MAKPKYIKVDDKLWERFKKDAKRRGVTLIFAVEEAFRLSLERKTA